MKSIAKKIVVFAMVGLLQLGLGTAVMEASPQQIPHQQKYEQRDNHKFQQEKERHERMEREKARHERLERENARHEREMQRRQHESEREWRERQHREQEHHDELVNAIMGVAILYALFSAN